MRILLIILCLNLWHFAVCQNHDHIWLMGSATEWGLNQLDFNHFPLELSLVPPGTIEFDLTNASACGADGGLLFYTNGIQVMDALHGQMENGDSLNPGDVSFAYYDGGYILAQGTIILPHPDGSNRYYLIHAQRELSGSVGIEHSHCSALYYSLIDMAANGGIGKVVEKNVPIVTDTLGLGKIKAVRHANGRDWWVVIGEYSRYNFYFVLIASDEITVLPVQTLDSNILYGDDGSGNAAFSPDGTKYARHDLRGFPEGHFVRLYDFDRCTGQLSDQVHIPLADTAGIGSVEFSPDSRYLYVPSEELVYQFDVTAPDVEATKTIVAVADGYQDTLDNGQLWFPTSFYKSQLGPDGRIYINPAGSGKHLHVIHRPNEPGLACDVRQHSLLLPTWNFRSMPNFPNHRLGPLDGSPCDTLGLDNRPLAGFTWEADTTDGLLVQFVDNSFYEPTDWLWDFGGTGSSTAEDPQHPFPADGTYTVCLTVSNPYDSDTFCREVTVSDLWADFSFQPEWLAVQFSDLTSSEPDNWRWDFGDGDTSVLQNPLHVYDGAGIYEVCLRASDAFGGDVSCHEVDVVVNAAGEVAAGRGAALVFFPNPANESVTAYLPHPVQGAIASLFDAIGLEVMSFDLGNGKVGTFGLETGTLAPGIYLCRVQDGGGRILTGRLVVSR